MKLVIRNVDDSLLARVAMAVAGTKARLQILEDDRKAGPQVIPMKEEPRGVPAGATVPLVGVGILPNQFRAPRAREVAATPAPAPEVVVRSTRRRDFDREHEIMRLIAEKKAVTWRDVAAHLRCSRSNAFEVIKNLRDQGRVIGYNEGTTVFYEEAEHASKVIKEGEARAHPEFVDPKKVPDPGVRIVRKAGENTLTSLVRSEIDILIKKQSSFTCAWLTDYMQSQGYDVSNGTTWRALEDAVVDGVLRKARRGYYVRAR